MRGRYKHQYGGRNQGCNIGRNGGNSICTYNTFTCINLFQINTYIETDTDANMEAETEAKTEADMEAYTETDTEGDTQANMLI